MTASPGFLPVVREWFSETYGEPTYPQLHGWQAISEGHHTLIVAPTGSGKTLAAFLWALDHLYRLGLDGRLTPRRHEPALLLNSCDPANLWGHVLPLARRDGSKQPVTRIPSNLLLVRGGSPRLLVEGYGRDLTPLAGFEIEELPQLIRVLQDVLKRSPALRPVRRIEAHTWDGRPVRQSEAAGPLQEAGFYGDGPRLLWDGYPGPRPRS